MVVYGRMKRPFGGPFVEANGCQVFDAGAMDKDLPLFATPDESKVFVTLVLTKGVRK